MNILNSINHNKLIIPIFTPFTYTISGGANYILLGGGEYPTLYPITLNPQSNVNSQTNLTTYCSINNFSNSNLQNTRVTIYIKGNFYYSSTKPYARLLAFTVSNFYLPGNNPGYVLQITGDGSTYSGKGVKVDYFDNNTKIMTGYTPSILANSNDIFHTFIRFNSSTSKASVYIYSKTGILLYNNAETTYFPSTCFGSNFAQFSMGRNMYSNTAECCYVTIYLAGWYGTMLSTNQMSNIVLSNL